MHALASTETELEQPTQRRPLRESEVRTHADAQPRLARQAAFDIAGITARTGEPWGGDAQGGAVGLLWHRFFDERVYRGISNRRDDMRLYGVYTTAEPGDRAAFDATVGVAVADPATSTVRIESGDYLVFTGRGEMPTMVRAVWRSIGQYFERHPEIRRRYRSDFEAYSGPDEVAIHIGVNLGPDLRASLP